MVRGLKDLSKTYSGRKTQIYPRVDRRPRRTPQYSTGPTYSHPKARRERSESDGGAHLASGLGGVVSSRGLVLSTTMKNAFVSEDPGIVLPLNGNPDEPLYLGQIR